MPEEIEAEMVAEQAASGAMARVDMQGDPDSMLAMLEKKAELSMRWKAAVERVLISQTYPEDWTIQGEADKARACLGSAGAERVGRMFGIACDGVKNTREDFTDSVGKGYRYICSAYMSLEGRRVYVEGTYSTRDEFLGKAHGGWRPLEDINEGDVRSAAHHICMGNGVKALLGLRGLPVAQYQRIMGATGQDAAKSSAVKRGQGTQGGSTGDDTARQGELWGLCWNITKAGYTAAKGDDGKWHPASRAEDDTRGEQEAALALCVLISGFRGKDGKDVAGKGPKSLSGKRLEYTLKTAQELMNGIAV